MKMSVKLKPLDEQVIVVTGASSGIGLNTARLAARRGAKLVLAARSTDALNQLVAEIVQEGGHALAVPADVSRQDDVRMIGETAIAAYGRIDSWVNNASVGLYGTTEEVSINDMRRLFETNFWGVVYGSREALKHLKTTGGAIINLGSEVS